MNHLPETSEMTQRSQKVIETHCSAQRAPFRLVHAEKPPSIVRLAPLMYVDSGCAR